MILGEAESDDPRALLRFGARVRVGYYDQELRGVDPDATLFEELVRLVGDGEAHNLLGRFMFPYDAQFKRVRDLSGGERARLALLKLTLGEYNFLVLDEPTNHLDVEMIEALEDALAAYTGTLLIVSHDRRFIAATTELVWELGGGTFTPYEGDWAFYGRKRAERAADESKVASSEPVQVEVQPESKTPSRWQLGRDLETLEARIAELETELGEIAGALETPETLTPDALVRLSENHGRLEAELLDAMAAWETTTEQLAEKA